MVTKDQKDQLKQLMEQTGRNTEIAEQAIKASELQGVRNDFAAVQKEIRTTLSELEYSGQILNVSLDDFKDETKTGMMMLDKKMQNGFEQSRNSSVDLEKFEELHQQFNTQIENIQNEVATLQERINVKMATEISEIGTKIISSENKLQASISEMQTTTTSIVDELREDHTKKNEEAVLNIRKKLAGLHKRVKVDIEEINGKIKADLGLLQSDQKVTAEKIEQLEKRLTERKNEAADVDQSPLATEQKKMAKHLKHLRRQST